MAHGKHSYFNVPAESKSLKWCSTASSSTVAVCSTAVYDSATTAQPTWCTNVVVKLRAPATAVVRSTTGFTPFTYSAAKWASTGISKYAASSNACPTATNFTGGPMGFIRAFSHNKERGSRYRFAEYGCRPYESRCKPRPIRVCVIFVVMPKKSSLSLYTLSLLVFFQRVNQNIVFMDMSSGTSILILLPLGLVQMLLLELSPSFICRRAIMSNRRRPVQQEL